MPAISLNNTLGAAFLGTIATSGIYGITIMQTYMYYKRNVKDTVYLKALVFLLWVLDSLHLALVVHAVYFYAVTNFTNVLALETPTWSLLTHIIVTGLSDLIVRGIFCHRVWRLSNGNYFLVVAIIITSLLVFSGSIAFAAKAFTIPSFFNLAKISDLLYISLGSGVSADVLIAGSMCFLLARRKTGFIRTNSMVHVLMMYSINTGALTSICALLTLLCYANMPDNFVFMAFYFILPKLFLNSLLAALNGRQSLRDNTAGGIVSFPLSATTNSRLSFSTGRPAFTQPILSPHDDQRNMQIQIQTTTDLKTDPSHTVVADEENKPCSYREVHQESDVTGIVVSVFEKRGIESGNPHCARIFADFTRRRIF